MEILSYNEQGLDKTWNLNSFASNICESAKRIKLRGEELAPIIFLAKGKVSSDGWELEMIPLEITTPSARAAAKIAVKALVDKFQPEFLASVSDSWTFELPETVNRILTAFRLTASGLRTKETKPKAAIVVCASYGMGKGSTMVCKYEQKGSGELSFDVTRLYVGIEASSQSDWLDNLWGVH